jgi:hypothetical protein
LRRLFVGLAAASLLVSAAPALPAAAQGGALPLGQSEPAAAGGYLAPSPLAYFPYTYYPVVYLNGWGHPFIAWRAIPSPAAQADATSPAGLLPGLGTTPCTLSSRWVPC